MKLKAVIIDDEVSAVRVLNALVQKYCPQVSIVSTFNDPVEGLEFLKNSEIDLLFLDIEMPRLAGFELLQSLEEGYSFEVIFTTAYDQYAMDAIKVEARDYLMKPVDEEDLIKAVQKVEDKKRLQKQDLESIVSKINSAGTHQNDKIAIPFLEGLEFIPVRDIIFCLAENNYTQIFLSDNTKRIVSKNLKEIEKLMPAETFFRVHNSYLINLNYVHKYVRTDGGYLVMTNGERVKISRSKKDLLLNKL